MRYAYGQDEVEAFIFLEERDLEELSMIFHRLDINMHVRFALKNTIVKVKLVLIPFFRVKHNNYLFDVSNIRVWRNTKTYKE